MLPMPFNIAASEDGTCVAMEGSRWPLGCLEHSPEGALSAPSFPHFLRLPCSRAAGGPSRRSIGQVAGAQGPQHREAALHPGSRLQSLLDEPQKLSVALSVAIVTPDKEINMGAWLAKKAKLLMALPSLK